MAVSERGRLEAVSTVAIVADRPRLERRARLLAWSGNTWHLIEFAIALGAGIAAGSVALIAFGVDSLIEVAAGLTIIWRFTGTRLASATSERSAQRVIALCRGRVDSRPGRRTRTGGELGRNRFGRRHGADAIDEYVPVEDLVTCAQSYAVAAMRFCGTAEAA